MQAFFFNDFKNSYIPQILEEIYIKKVYAPYLEGKTDLTIVDWGGNIGLTSHYFKDFAKTVYYVEPAQKHIECARQMIEQNNINNIKVCPYAISDTNGKAKLHHCENATMHSLREVVGADFEEVETVTPDEFMKQEGIEKIDLLKFDTEGLEGEIIRSESFKNIASKINLIIGEWHTWATITQEDIVKRFTELGFAFSWADNTDAKVFIAINKNATDFLSIKSKNDRKVLSISINADGNQLYADNKFSRLSSGEMMSVIGYLTVMLHEGEHMHLRLLENQKKS